MAYTDEERIAARRAAWQKYNVAHKEARAAHNKEYVQKPIVKERRRQKRVQARNSGVQSPNAPVNRVGPTTDLIDPI